MITHDRPYLRVASTAAHWLNRVAIEQSGACFWKAAPDVPYGVHHCSLYYGSAGIILFLLEYARVTGDDRFLELAIRSGDGLVVLAKRESGQLQWTLPWDSSRADLSLYLGGAGISFALAVLEARTGEGRFQVAAREAADGVLTLSQQWPFKARPFDLSTGLAGIGLFCLDASTRYRDGAFVAHAAAVGDFFIELESQRAEYHWWRRANGEPLCLPNFSHGLAGVGYFQARLYVATRREQYLHAATRIARWLSQCGDRTETTIAWPYQMPRDGTPDYCGWCHGPAGTARFFALLHEATGEQDWRQEAARCLAWIETRGLELRDWSGLWNASMCCGLAGIGDAFLWASSIKPASTSLVHACADAVVRLARTSEAGSKWIQAEMRVQPTVRVAQTGYSQGAAGIGLFLLRAARLGGEVEPFDDLALPDSLIAVS